jgi:hypothetical protein
VIVVMMMMLLLLLMLMMMMVVRSVPAPHLPGLEEDDVTGHEERGLEHLELPVALGRDLGHQATLERVQTEKDHKTTGKVQTTISGDNKKSPGARSGPNTWFES